MKTQETSRHLADAVIRVPRHAFIPDQAWTSGSSSGAGHWIDRHREPEAWWQAVYADTVIYTQLDDGNTPLTPENAAKTFAPTCSASSPILIAAFLRHLAVQSGDSVLEIGTGTGWTAGLLSYLAGDEGLVTSIDIDSELSATAEANLRSVGLVPHLVVADGEVGAPDLAPFDRVHVTCGVQAIPYEWIEQTAPGGVIVLPYQPTARLLRLTVHDDGTAIGGFHDVCSFMLLRAQRRPVSRIADTTPRVRDLERDPEQLLNPDPGLQVLLNDLVGATPFRADTQGLLFSGESRATVEDGQVTQIGPRDLWDEAEAVHRVWEQRGRPGLDRMGLTVTPERQYVWLDNPTVPAAQEFDKVKGNK
jgi:protein-L-isoaspartate(D-aspartate) O-methyltransferase